MYANDILSAAAIENICSKDISTVYTFIRPTIFKPKKMIHIKSLLVVCSREILYFSLNVTLAVISKTDSFWIRVLYLQQVGYFLNTWW